MLKKEESCKSTQPVVLFYAKIYFLQCPNVGTEYTRSTVTGDSMSKEVPADPDLLCCKAAVFGEKIKETFFIRHSTFAGVLTLISSFIVTWIVPLYTTA
jgi:hypothetical protein